MTAEPNRPSGGLGRGLAALIPPSVGARLLDVPTASVRPNPRQPRGSFDPEELERLAISIGDLGLLQPVIVRRSSDGNYELVAGERRWRAARIAGLPTIPAVVRETDDDALLKEALVENIHRVPLNPLEEAAAYRQLLDDLGFTQEELAARLGRARPTISNALRLLQLPPPIQRRVAAGVLSAGHARALLALEDDVDRVRVADRVVAENLSVRAVEEIVRIRLMELEGGPAGDEPPTGGRGTRRARQRRTLPPALAELQDDLALALDTRVRVVTGRGRGRLQIEFSSPDDLRRLVGIIARGLDGSASSPGRDDAVDGVTTDGRLPAR